MQPTVLVIFGVTGDLAQRKLLPALTAIARNDQLPPDFKVLGLSRRDLELDKILPSSSRKLASLMNLQQLDMASSSDYKVLKKRLSEISPSHETQIIFYFAVPPAAVPQIVKHLGAAGLNGPRHKLLLEKPFGVDYESAAELIAQTNKSFKEEQVYRIDHFLAKEMAQNIAVFLGGNVLFRDVWNNKFIDKIEIIAAEEIDIEGRVAFYEQAGALRDLVQSHLLQLAALTLMKPCHDVFDFSEMSERRLVALRNLKLDESIDFYEAVVRAQYQGYPKEVNNPKTTTETFVSMRLQSEDPNWAGVPVQLITGKALDSKYTEIRVYFKRAEVKQTNLLRLRIQPREGIELDLWVKKPGYEHTLQKLPLGFSYEQHFGANLPDAYEQVLIDATRSRNNLFASSKEILASWKLLDPILKKWSMNSDDLKNYKKGSKLEKVLSRP